MGHAHFGSATNFAATILEVLLGLTLVRLVAFHLAASKKTFLSGIGRALLVQTG